MQVDRLKFSGLRGVAFYVGIDAEMYGSDAGFHDMQSAYLESINIFAGRNGTGKSTLLDILRALSEPHLFHSLKRDVLRGNVFHGLDITFKGQNSKYLPSPNPLVLHVEFESTKIPVLALRVFDRANYSETVLDGFYPAIGAGGISKADEEKIVQIIDKMGLEISYWGGPEQASLDAGFVQSLQGLKHELAGVCSVEPYSATAQLASRSVNLRLISDPGIVQAIPYEYLPSGWRAAAGLLAWVRKQKNESILIVEEPECHLHPRLQRLLAASLATLVKEKSLQLLISSHSPVFLSSNVWKPDGSADAASSLAIFHVDGRSIRAIQGPRVANSPSQLLAELGVKASDLYQSNFVIWVEGPSDRIYVKYWLERWCEAHEQIAPSENLHYSFILYGGTILSHYHAGSVGTVDETISMFRINQNSFVIMDRDHDFTLLDGALVRTKHSSAKYRVQDALKESEVWITCGYTMESYLPDRYVQQGFLVEKDNGSLTIGTAMSKVALAQKYKRDTMNTNFYELFKFGAPDPSVEIEKIFRGIISANS